MSGWPQFTWSCSKMFKFDKCWVKNNLFLESAICSHKRWNLQWLAVLHQLFILVIMNMDIQTVMIHFIPFLFQLLSVLLTFCNLIINKWAVKSVVSNKHVVYFSLNSSHTQEMTITRRNSMFQPSIGV